MKQQSHMIAVASVVNGYITNSYLKTQEIAGLVSVRYQVKALLVSPPLTLDPVWQTSLS